MQPSADQSRRYVADALLAHLDLESSLGQTERCMAHVVGLGEMRLAQVVAINALHRPSLPCLTDISHHSDVTMY